MTGLDACTCERMAVNGTALQAVWQVSWMGHSDSCDRAAGDVIFVKFPNKTVHSTQFSWIPRIYSVCVISVQNNVRFLAQMIRFSTSMWTLDKPYEMWQVYGSLASASKECPPIIVMTKNIFQISKVYPRGSHHLVENQCSSIFTPCILSQTEKFLKPQLLASKQPWALGATVIPQPLHAKSTSLWSMLLSLPFSWQWLTP